MLLCEGVPLEQGHQRRVPPIKRRHFVIIGSSSVKTVTDRYRHVAYHIASSGHGLLSFININDLEPPKLGDFMNFV